MLNAEYDLRYVKSGIEDLEAYLLSDELYWPVQVSPPAGQPPYQQMTPGGLLLAMQRLKATARTPQQQNELQALQTQFEAGIQRWRSAWERKGHKDIVARLRLWSNFLEEYRQQPSANLDRYPYEVNRRIQVELLQTSIAGLEPSEEALLAALDKLLHAVLLPGRFVWHPSLQPVFPNPPYWQLYGKLKTDAPGE